MFNILANLFNIIEIIFYIICSFQISKKKVLYYQIMEALTGMLAMIFVFNVSSLIMYIFQLIKIIFAYYIAGTDILKKGWCKILILLFCCFTLYLGIITNEFGYLNLILVFALTLNTACMFLTSNVTLYKTSLFLSDIGYGVTYYVSGLYIGFIFNIISMIFLFINIIRLKDVQKNELVSE